MRSMPRLIHAIVLISYFAVGYTVPLGVRSTAAPDSEIVTQQKGRTLLKKASRTRSMWKLVKHVPSQQKHSDPNQSFMIRSMDDAGFDWQTEYLGEAFIASVAHARSPLHRELRAPPIS